MERSLRDEAVRERNAKQSGDPCGEAKKEDIPMESGRLAEGELCALSNQGRDYVTYELVDIVPIIRSLLTVVIEPKQYSQQDRERDGEKNIADTNLPETNEPASILGWEEGCTGRKRLDWHARHAPDVDEPGKEDNGQGRAIVFDELSHLPLEQIAIANRTANISSHENEKRKHDGDEGGCISRQLPLSCQDLDSFLEVDEGHVESEDVAAEASHICQAVARVCDGKNPMHER